MGVFFATLLAAAGGATAVYLYHVHRCKELGIKPVGLGKALKSVIDTLKNVHAVDELSYDFVMKATADNRPDDIRVVKAALLCETQENGEKKISIIYMDKKNQPVFGDGSGKEYGSSYSSKKVSQDLLDLFEKDNMVILE